MTRPAPFRDFTHRHGSIPPLETERARAMRTVSFKAWIGSISIPVPPHAQEFAEVLSACVTRCSHKDVLTLLREDAGRREKELRFYAIKRSTKNGQWRAAYDGGRRVFVGNLEPHLIHSAAVHSFEPVEAFDAFRDDPVGIDRSLVIAGSQVEEHR